MTAASDVIEIQARSRKSDAARPGVLPQVVIAHPGRQYSHHLALGLARAGMLRAYLTGVPTHRHAGGWLLSRALGKYAAVYEIPLDSRLVRHHFVSPFTQKVASRLLPRRRAASIAHRADGWFDWLTAKSIARLQPDVVIAYENSALHAFRAARSMGAVTVLDAASFHHAWQDRFYEPVESPAAHRRVVQRKEAELALADHVITVSDLARESYISAGLPSQRVHASPLGAEFDQFKPHKRTVEESRSRPVRYAFVGHIDRRKGADVLADAARHLHRSGSPVSLGLFGKRYGDVGLEDLPGVTYHGWLPHRELAVALAEYDVLVLPSRHDSFGMVVAEAMACGLPTIVSDHVGAKELIDPGSNGLIVSAGDAVALAEAMQWFAGNCERIPAMADAARQTAMRYTWQAYKERTIALLQRIASSR
jgi:glycosyltransferase involved in cell wall biosynthesis